MTPTERIRIQRHFAAAIATLECMAVWYSPDLNRIFTRSHPFDPATIHVHLRGKRAIPADAIRVGDYAMPFPSSQFMDDLAEAIRRVQVLKRAA